MITGVSPDLPHTHHLPPGKEWGLRVVKPIAAAILRGYWRVQVHGSEHVPTTGPVILAANHIAMLDGPVVVALTRRLTFAMGKNELFVGFGGRILALIGQIPLNRKELDLQAIRRAVQVLRADKVLAVFPEGVRTGGEVAWAKGGAAYLAMVSGAPVVPVAILGTREPGQTRSQVPRRRCPDPPGLRRADHGAAVALAPAQAGRRGVDRGDPPAAGGSRGRGPGADRATLARAPEAQADLSCEVRAHD